MYLGRISSTARRERRVPVPRRHRPGLVVSRVQEPPGRVSGVEAARRRSSSSATPTSPTRCSGSRACTATALDEVARPSGARARRARRGAPKRGVWSRVHTAAVRAYETDVATGVAGAGDPPLVRQLALSRTPSARLRFESSVERALRPGQPARPTSPPTCRSRRNESADFARDLPTSVLPLIIDLAQRARPAAVLRARAAPARAATSRRRSRPTLRRATSPTCAPGSRPTARCSTTTPAIPRLTLDLYADGDHVARSPPLHRRSSGRRLDPLFR